MQWKKIMDVLSGMNVANGYLYDFGRIKNRYCLLQEALGPLFHILFSVKANPNPVLLRYVAMETSAGADVSSGKELTLAIASAFSRNRIFFVGPGKGMEELKGAIVSEIGCIVAESRNEIDSINSLGEMLGKKVPIIIRVNPDYPVKGIKMAMGGRATQFGIDQGHLLNEIRRLIDSCHHIDFQGIHAYVGTRILKAEDAVWNITQILNLAKELHGNGFPIRVVDVGGGFGIPYYQSESELDLSVVQRLLGAFLSDYPEALKKETQFFLEAGRFLVGPCGYFLARVQQCWVENGEQNIEIHAKPSLHTVSEGGLFASRQIFHTAVLKESGLVEGELTTQLWFRNHGFRDRWPTSAKLPKMEPGDYLIFKNSGAYGPTASRVWKYLDGHPAEFSMLDGNLSTIRAPDSWSSWNHEGSLY